MNNTQQPESHEVEQEAKVISSAPIYTYILLGSIAAVFVAQLLFGDALSTLSFSNLVGDNRSAIAAGFVKPYFVNYHEYWRILTGAAVHGGVLHVAMNGYALLMLGRICELLSNRAHLALVFLLSCIGGGLLSLYFLPDSVSVGASGGIVGVLGYITIYAFRRRRFISPQFRKSLLINLGFLVVFGLVLFNVVDNYGHLGGLIVGVAYGLIQIPSNEYVDPRASRPVTKAFGIAALGVFMAACLLSICLIFSFRNTVIPESLNAASPSSPTR
ncbi:MAG: rhomboid family intramembrane serine protease [Pyrinomonadaceae bacterium]